MEASRWVRLYTSGFCCVVTIGFVPSWRLSYGHGGKRGVARGESRGRMKNTASPEAAGCRIDRTQDAKKQILDNN